MQRLKNEYNITLQRYYNGCQYLSSNTDKWDKYFPEVQKLLNRINEILELIPATKEEILNGFK